MTDLPKVLLVFLLSYMPWATANPVAIALHGGAGTLTRNVITTEQEQAYLEILNEAVEQGY